MKDVFPKFIIESGQITLGKVTFHKELAVEKENVTGGGWFHYNSKDNCFILYGESIDFGKATMEMIQEALKGGVYSYGVREITDSIYYTDDIDFGTPIKLR